MIKLNNNNNKNIITLFKCQNLFTFKTKQGYNKLNFVIPVLFIDRKDHFTVIFAIIVQKCKKYLKI